MGNLSTHDQQEARKRIVAAIWGVKSAPTNDRLFATILFAGFALMVSGFGYIASIPPRKSVVVVAKPIPHIGIFLVGTYVLSVLSLSLAIALTYSSPEIGMLGRLGGWVAGIGQYIFPVVTKYETQMQLSPSELFRAQSIYDRIFITICFERHYLYFGLPLAWTLLVGSAGSRSTPAISFHFGFLVSRMHRILPDRLFRCVRVQLVRLFGTFGQ